QIITAIVGNGSNGGSGDGGPGPMAMLALPKDMALGSDGALYVSDARAQVRRLGSPLPKLPDGSFTVPSADGSEAYLFDKSGRHQQTLDTHTAKPFLTFSYDARGRLSQIADADGNTTRVERDGAGQANAIVGPFGDRTQL